MRAAEKKLVERNLDLIFEFEKYVFGAPGDYRKDPARRGRVYESGRRQKVQSLERAPGEKAGQKRGASYFGHGEKAGPDSFANRRTRFRARRLIRLL
jgi:hypothetical protein